MKFHFAFIIGIGKQSNIPIEYFRSETFKVETEREIECKASEITKTKWLFYNGEYLNNIIQLDGISNESSNIVIKKRVLPFGLYKICATTMMNIDSRFQATACGYVLIKATPLEAHLIGGNNVRYPNTNDVSIFIKLHVSFLISMSLRTLILYLFHYIRYSKAHLSFIFFF